MFPDPAHEPLDRNTFNKHLDNMLITGTLNPDILCYCVYKKQRILNEVKKALVRISNKK